MRIVDYVCVIGAIIIVYTVIYIRCIFTLKKPSQVIEQLALKALKGRK